MSVKQYAAVCSQIYIQEWDEYLDPGTILPQINVVRPQESQGLELPESNKLLKPYESDKENAGKDFFDTLVHYVKSGDGRAANSYLRRAFEIYPTFKHDTDLLRCGFIGLNTILAQNAAASGLDVDVSEKLWFQYSQKAIATSDSQSLKNLKSSMLSDYSSRIEICRNRYSNTVALCCHYISEHLSECIDLTTVAKQVNLSPHYLSLLFKKETGISVPIYIQREKIRTAKKLLTLTRYSLIEISCILNFSSQSYFSTVFRKNTGLTPKKYRETYSMNR